MLHKESAEEASHTFLLDLIGGKVTYKHNIDSENEMKLIIRTQELHTITKSFPKRMRHVAAKYPPEQLRDALVSLCGCPSNRDSTRPAVRGLHHARNMP